MEVERRGVALVPTRPWWWWAVATPNETYDAPKTNIAILIPCLVNCAKPVQPETLVRALDRTHTLLVVAPAIDNVPNGTNHFCLGRHRLGILTCRSSMGKEVRGAEAMDRERRSFRMRSIAKTEVERGQ
jgi:hypothetical protein